MRPDSQRQILRPRLRRDLAFRFVRRKDLVYRFLRRKDSPSSMLATQILQNRKDWALQLFEKGPQTPIVGFRVRVFQTQQEKRMALRRGSWASQSLGCL